MQDRDKYPNQMGGYGAYGGAQPPPPPPPPPGPPGFYAQSAGFHQDFIPHQPMMSQQGGWGGVASSAPPLMMGGSPNVYNDANTVESGFLGSSNSFSEIRIRHQFIRKVYSIVSLQILVTTAFIAFIKLTPSVRDFFYVNSWILWLLIIGTFIIMFVLACFESVSRSYPLNLILLMVFTVLESVLMGCISSRYNTDTLLIAAGITCLVVVGITLFAFQTKIDFTGFGIYLFVFALVLFGFGLIAIIIRSQIMNLIYSAVGAVLFSFYLVFDTQLMMGGKHKYSISPEDYIIAALNLYVDIINLFLMILRLVSAAKD